MDRRLLFALPLLTTLMPGLAAAQTDQQLRQCNGQDPALAIIGCTAVVDARDATPIMRSRALTNRGFAYMNRGQMERALPDFERAIMLDSKNATAYIGRASFYHQ